MSYDLYLYKSSLGKPDTDEASKVIDDDNDIWVKRPYNYEKKVAIEKALIKADPTLEGFNYEQLAQKKAKTVDEIKRDFMKFELNSSSNEPRIQLEIYDYHVDITLPYTYTGDEAIRAFGKLRLYVDTINQAAGYFVYDPQTGESFDPVTRNLDGLAKYLSVSNDFDAIVKSV